jgi:hypothetical protein
MEKEYLDSWHEGVLNAAEVAWPPGSLNQIGVDTIGANASPHAWNTVLATIAGKAVPRKRDGCNTMNRTPLSGSPKIHAMYPYRYRDDDSGVVTQYHLLVGDDGSLSWMNESGTVVVINATAFTPGTAPPAFATLNNLCFIANGDGPIKLDGATEQVFGIVRPEVGSARGDAQTAGSLLGEYEFRFTYYNEDTGHESSASDSTPIVVVNNSTITVSAIPVSTDAQVTHVRIYIRNTETQTEFYRIETVANGTTTVEVDGVDANLVDIAPDTSENDPPPDSIRYLAAHKSRLFAADEGKLYWSEVDDPESFDPDAYDFVNRNDGQKITGIASLPGGWLLILKEDSYYILEGDTPGIWRISRVGPAVGCVSHRSIVIGADGTYWWSGQGPVRLSFGDLTSPRLIGSERISAVISQRSMNYAKRDEISAAFDIDNQRILFAIPEQRSLVNTKMLAWSSELGAWESDRWDPMDVGSLTTVNDASSQPFVMIGGLKGQVFKLGAGSSDGIASGDFTGTFVASATSQTTITDVTAAFDTTGGGLIERKLTILDSTDLPLAGSGIRPKVVSNTGTVLTLNKAISGLTVGATYTYIVGGQDFEFDTSWRDAAAPFDKKRLEFFYLNALLYGHDLFVDLHLNQRSNTLALSRFATVEGDGALWNEFDWNDGTLWNSADMTYARLRGGVTGVTFAFRMRNPYPYEPTLILKAGLRTVTLDDKLG